MFVVFLVFLQVMGGTSIFLIAIGIHNIAEVHHNHEIEFPWHERSAKTSFDEVCFQAKVDVADSCNSPYSYVQFKNVLNSQDFITSFWQPPKSV